MEPAAIEHLPEVRLPLGSLGPGFRLRQGGMDADHVRLLADAAGSAVLPPMLVQKDGLRIIDGVHRAEAARLRGERTVSARIVDCCDAEALVLAVRSNTLHGLPLSRAERIASAEQILGAYPDWSDRVIAGVAGLSAKAIASLRKSPAEAEAVRAGEPQVGGKRLGRDGKRRPVIPAQATRRAAEYISAHPSASVREVARAADVSVGTAHGVLDQLRREEYGAAQSPDQPATPAPVPPAPAPTPSAAAPILPIPPAAARPAPIRVLPGGRAGRPRPGRPAGYDKLSADPALRYSERGRTFLRWMAERSAHVEEWREFIDAIPQHWLHDVSLMAASMSEEWRQFSEQLADRERNAS